MIKKLLLLGIFLVSVFLLSSFSSKQISYAACDPALCTGSCGAHCGTNPDGTPRCEGQTNRCVGTGASATCSCQDHGAVGMSLCGGSCGTPGTTACGDTDCTKADGTHGCDSGTCTGTKPNPPGTGCSCQASGGGAGGAQQPVIHYAVGDPSYCIAVNAACGGSDTDLMGKYCCAGTSCQNTYGEHGATNDWNCFPIPKAAATFNCSGTSCDTAVGPIPINAGGFVQKLFAIVLSISGGIAVLLIILSGYKLMVSQGNPEKLQGAREQFTAAIVGLLFIILSLVILQIIGVDILKLPGFTP